MKKKYIYIIAIVVVIIATTIALIFLLSKKLKKRDNIEINNNVTLLKSTEKNPISKDGIEATNIEITKITDGLEIKAIIRNNTFETVNGVYFEIMLLDKKGNLVTTISDNYNKSLKPYEDYLFTTGLVGQDQINDIVEAKIEYIQKNTNIKDNK